MTGKIKAVGLAHIAAMAMSAVVASAASAQHRVQTEGGTVHFTGTQATQNIFSTPAGEVKCNTTSFVGTATHEAATVTAIPTYSNCTHSLVGAAPVINEGCAYILSGETDVNEDAPVTVECAMGKHITIELSGVFGLVNCNLTIGEQTPNGGVSYTNGGTGTTRDVTVDATATGIEYTKVSKGGGGCGLVGGDEKDGQYTGSVTVSGYSDTNHTTHAGIWME